MIPTSINEFFSADVSGYKRQRPPAQQPPDEPLRRPRAPEQPRFRRRNRNNGEDAVETGPVPRRAAVQVRTQCLSWTGFFLIRLGLIAPSQRPNRRHFGLR